jgi:uncharacterized membrane protein YhaH (DUF805 family)
MSVINKIWGLQGRIPRGVFWTRTVLIWCVVFIFQSSLPGVGTIVLAMSGVLALAALISQCIKRLHDCGYSAAWLLVVFVPVFGALWLIWLLAFKSGQASDNAWGSTQHGSTHDFLTVR